MKNFTLTGKYYILLSLFAIGCSNHEVENTPKFEIPIRTHDLSYIPFDASLDDPNYIICDTAAIKSGRSRLKYIGGANKFRQDITSKYLFKQKYNSFNGYIVIRFIINCNNEAGRFRAQSLDLDFSPLNAPAELLTQSINLAKNLNNWTRPKTDTKEEYSKFINLKMNNGQIQYVLL